MMATWPFVQKSVCLLFVFAQLSGCECDIRCPPCSKGCLLEDAAEDFSLDIWSSVKGTVGMGSGMAPAVTLFGPPGRDLQP